MTDEKVTLPKIKEKIEEDYRKMDDYDRLTLSKKSKELLGIITASYGSFPLILDDNVSDKLTIAQYQAIYKALSLTASQSVNFVATVRTMLGITPTPIPKSPEEFQEELSKQEKTGKEKNKKVVSKLKKETEEKVDTFRENNKKEPWVV